MQRLPTIDEYPARLRFRFCPLCATPLERRMEGDHLRLVCPTDGWIHYPTPNLAATVVVEHDGGVVLLQRAIAPDIGIWHLPIGHIEYGEVPAEAARREVAEETGLQVDELVFLDYEHSPSYGDPLMHYIVFCFAASAIGGALRVDAENSSAWVCRPDRLPQLKWTSQRRALAAWRARRAGQLWAIGRPLDEGGTSC
jgi:ADP-ribose pyrophosphatase YjhB (NUDIX family)